MIHKVIIPTTDLTGMLGDVLPFAADKRNDEMLAYVRLDWDGATGMLHAQATNRLVAGVASWHPDDSPERDMQLDLFTEPGGGSDSWYTYVPVDACKEIRADFKLSEKDALQVQITLTWDADYGRLTVHRDRSGSRSGKTLQVDCEPIVADYPDIRDSIASAAMGIKDGARRSVPDVSYNPDMLAKFSGVRPRGGHLTLTFLTERMTIVGVGHRFTGIIQPVREPDPRDNAPARVSAEATTGADMLRHGSGVVLSSDQDRPDGSRAHDDWLSQ